MQTLAGSRTPHRDPGSPKVGIRIISSAGCAADSSGSHRCRCAPGGKKTDQAACIGWGTWPTSQTATRRRQGKPPDSARLCRRRSPVVTVAAPAAPASAAAGGVGVVATKAPPHSPSMRARCLWKGNRRSGRSPRRRGARNQRRHRSVEPSQKADTPTQVWSQRCRNRARPSIRWILWACSGRKARQPRTWHRGRKGPRRRTSNQLLRRAAPWPALELRRELAPQAQTLQPELARCRRNSNPVEPPSVWLARDR
mmetsp:Transcript_111844/g.315951  ORF Transcript_111844/g.315951 Transcript_111844/m.315951 type:complete len:254 (+) Transcript_111844:46-807(+)